MEKVNVRAFFEKKGRAIYISHLDLMRTMQRALKRSGLPVWFTEGYNPRIYLNFPLALSLGTEGGNEPMDLAIIEEVSFDEIVDRLNSVMPEGLKITRAAYPIYPNKVIGAAEYLIDFSGNPQQLRNALDSFMAQEKIEVEKHSKRKGMITIDIRPHIQIKNVCESENGLCVELILPAGLELNLNAGIFTDSFAEFCESNNINMELSCIKRTNIYCSDGNVFE